METQVKPSPYATNQNKQSKVILGIKPTTSVTSTTIGSS